MSREINRQMARGGAWMISMRWMMRGIGFFSTLVLVRLLNPEDFGIIAMAMIVIGLLEILGQTGVDLALIRIESPEKQDYDAAFTLQILISSLITLLLFLSSFPAADMFDEPRLVAVMQIMCIRSLIAGWSNIGTVDFRRSYDFAKEFRFNVYKKIISFLTVLTLALILRNYWALVFGMIAAEAAGVMLSYAMSPFRPRFNFRRIPSLLHFSSWLVVSRILRYFLMRLDQFVVGNVAGSKFMGNYYVAYDIATSPSSEIVMPVTRGLFPVYARLQSDPAKLVESYLQSLSAVSLIIMPLGFGLSLVSGSFVPVVLGPSWVAATPLISTLAIYGVVAGINSTLEGMMMAIGKVRLMALISGMQVLVLGTALYMIARYASVDLIAVSRLAIAGLSLPFAFLLIGRFLPLGLGKVLLTLMPRLLAVGLMAIGVMLVRQPDWKPWQSLTLEVMTGAVIFILSTMMIWHIRKRPAGVEAALLDQATKRLFRKKTVGS